MKYRILPFFWTGVFCMAGLLILSSGIAQDREYVLVWADEFDRDGRPDSSNWIYEHGFVRNQEDQWYQAENAWIENGRLIIEARQETRPNPWFQPESEHWTRSRSHYHYTSACLKTRGKRAFQYGRFEMRAKIDVRPGMWPAFWTLGVEGEWPSGGECDIMEYFRGMLLANFAWGSERRYVPIWDDSRLPIDSLGEGWADEFHVWRLDWDEKSMKIYVDDRLLNEVDLSDTVNRGDHKNPFHQPHYLLLNLAIGGANGGYPSKTEFPARFEVDYVRVYQ